MKMSVVRTGDGKIHKFDTQEQAGIFIDGFMAALKCYGEWFQGIQTIGPLATPIKNITLKIYEEEISEIIKESSKKEI